MDVCVFLFVYLFACFWSLGVSRRAVGVRIWLGLELSDPVFWVQNAELNSVS